MKSKKIKISVGKKPVTKKSVKSTNPSLKDQIIREKYIAKITGNSSLNLEASC